MLISVDTHIQRDTSLKYSEDTDRRKTETSNNETELDKMEKTNVKNSQQIVTQSGLKLINGNQIDINFS